jgi:hypothetical protein
MTYIQYTATAKYLPILSYIHLLLLPNLIVLHFKMTRSQSRSESQHDHRRLSCDDLLVTTEGGDTDTEEPVDCSGILGRRSGFRSEVASNIRRRQMESVKRRAFLVRSLALLCACSLSIGSH